MKKPHCTCLLIWLLPILMLAGCGTSSHHKTHQHRNPSDIQQYIARLDRTERDVYQQPEKVLAALNLKPTTTLADLGSGSGYFTRRFAKALYPDGKVYALDVEPQMLDYSKQSVREGGPYADIHFQLVKPDDPGLPVRSVDMIFLCNVYHHLEQRRDYFRKARAALKEGGRVVIIDFYHDERSGKLGFPRHHLIPRDTVLKEMTAAGFHLAKEHDLLERQYFLEFRPGLS